MIYHGVIGQSARAGAGCVTGEVKDDRFDDLQGNLEVANGDRVEFFGEGLQNPSRLMYGVRLASDLITEINGVEHSIRQAESELPDDKDVGVPTNGVAVVVSGDP